MITVIVAVIALLIGMAIGALGVLALQFEDEIREGRPEQY